MKQATDEFLLHYKKVLDDRKTHEVDLQEFDHKVDDFYEYRKEVREEHEKKCKEYEKRICELEALLSEN